MQKFRRSLCVRLCVGLIGFILFISIASKNQRENVWWKRALLMSTELPVGSLDPDAIDLTELVNKMINTALEGNQQFFSLLGVTSHSSLALHKVSILIYDISSFWIIDSSVFPLKYCYCLNNRTNDLTDFTAVVVDFVGNTTSFFKEIFKSNSILYVSKNETDCIFICVMAGVLDRDMTSPWFSDSMQPVINETFYNRKPTKTASTTVSTLITTATEGLGRMKTTTLQAQPPTGSPKYEAQATPSITIGQVHSNCRGVPRHKEKEKPIVGVQTINRCVLELCRFFQRCLCKMKRRIQTKRTALMYCTDYYSWYQAQKNNICKITKGFSSLRSLMKICLSKICKSTRLS
ncbi:HERV-H LTR-associating protein 1 [Amblyraja radiata]|uniref:HERV-H LTR-associating protein 1 n=1 Tax=Amblyraja radiata TaxID=386614 RepID=UPI00140319E4|nr:HERV-H LTR-associating protein 1 [Amblyraja radiata]